MQRPQPLHPCPADIEREHEIRLMGFVDLPIGLGDGARESGGMRTGRQGRFEQHQFLQRHPLAQAARLMDQQAGEILRLQPDAGKGMALGNHDHRIEPGLFRDGREQQSGVEAGCEAAVDHVRRRADLLPLQLETGWRLGIGQPEPADGRPDRGGEFVHPGPALRLIAFDPVRPAAAAQHVARGLDEAADRRIVGQDKGCEQFGHRRRAAPFIAGQQLDGEIAMRAALRFPFGLRMQAYGRAHCFGQLQQQAGVELEIALGDMRFTTGRDAVDPPLHRFEYRRIGLDPHDDIFDRRGAQIEQTEIAQHGHGALVRGEADFGNDRRIDSERLPAQRARLFPIDAFGSHRDYSPGSSTPFPSAGS